MLVPVILPPLWARLTDSTSIPVWKPLLIEIVALTRLVLSRLLSDSPLSSVTALPPPVKLTVPLAVTVGARVHEW